VARGQPNQALLSTEFHFDIPRLGRRPFSRRAWRSDVRDRK
jgi:hypothetical protein